MNENIWKFFGVCVVCCTVFSMQYSYANDAEYDEDILEEDETEDAVDEDSPEEDTILEEDDEEDDLSEAGPKRIYDPKERERARKYVRSVFNKLLRTNNKAKSNPIKDILSPEKESRRVIEQKNKLLQARAILDNLIANLGNYGKYEVDKLRKDINSCIDRFEKELKELNGVEPDQNDSSDSRNNKRKSNSDNDDDDEVVETSRKKRKKASRAARKSSNKAKRTYSKSYAKPYGKSVYNRIHTVKNVPITANSNSYLKNNSIQGPYKIKYYGNQNQISPNTVKVSAKSTPQPAKSCCSCCSRR